MSDIPPVDTSELARVQRWFQAVLTDPAGIPAGVESAAARQEFPEDSVSVDTLLTGSSKLTPSDRLAVYANAYFARLVECLGEVFPILKRTLGEEVFTGFATDYLREHPSRAYTLHLLGARFPQFLAEGRPPRDEIDTPDWADFLVDLARFEWDLYEVFDGPGIEDTPRLDPTALAALDGPAGETARLIPAPCLRLFTGRFPVSDFYTHARAADPAVELEMPDPQPIHVAITRRDYVVRRLPLDPREYHLLDALVRGTPLGTALDTTAELESVEPVRIAGWFTRWAREDLFVGLE